MLAEDHSRPAARFALTQSLSELQLRKYDTFMREGIGCGKTLDEEISRAREMEQSMKLLFGLYPRIEVLLNQRDQLTADAFQQVCLKELSNIKLSNSQINVLMSYDRNNINLYQELIRHGFAYKNLDEPYSKKSFQKLDSRKSLDERDDLYANEIARAYKEGRGIVSILGGLHLLPDITSSKLYDFFYGKRRLIGDRLDEMSIPYIGLFPFDSQYVASMDLTKIWQARSFQDFPNPANMYSIDISRPQGMRHFLQVIDNLIIARNSSATKTTSQVRFLV